MVNAIKFNKDLHKLSKNVIIIIVIIIKNEK